LIYIVFCKFNCFAYRGIATGYYTDDPVKRNTESRWAFGSIQYAKTPAGSGSDVKHPTARFHFIRYYFGQLLNLRDNLFNGIRYSLVLSIDIFEDFLH